MKSLVLPFSLSVVLVAGLSACATSGTATSAAEESAIREARIVQTRAIADGDLDRVQSYWTPDVTIRRAMGQAVTGAEEARKVLVPPPAGAPAVIYQRETTAVEVSSNWPLAYEEGRWAGYLGSIASTPVLSGRYSAQWVKRDGKWLIRSEVFVSLGCSGVGCTYKAAP